MNFMKRAFLSLVRRKGKSLILLVIVFNLFCFVKRFGE